MRNRFSWLLWLLCILNSMRLAAPADSIPKMSQNGEIPFQLHHGFLILVPIQIGSQSNLKFILDTGTTRTVVDKRVARKLGMQGVPATVLTMHKGREVDSAVFSEVQFGPVRATNMRLLIADVSSFSEFANGVDGLLGLDLLWGNKVLIDYKSKILVLDPVSTETGRSNQQDEDLCVAATADIDGNPVRLILDTGTRGLLLYADRVRQRIRRVPAWSTEIVRVGNAMFAYKATVDRLRVGTAEMRNLDTLLVSSAPAGFPGDIDGFLGTESLKPRRLIFDFSHKTMTWQH